MADTLQSSAIDKLIGEIVSLPREELAAQWIKIYGHPPPKGVKKRFLERGLAYRAQCKRLGGLNRKTRRQMEVGSSSQASAKSETRFGGPAPGTRLIREWNGRSYTVEVLENGFSFKGATYNSLSAIAREITGARWSGPRFFGL